MLVDVSTLGFIDLGAPFIDVHVIGLHPFRVWQLFLCAGLLWVFRGCLWFST
ncbi:MAG: hypothetical protein QXK07_08040 [Desulfurococcaceae archaeon]